MIIKFRFTYLCDLSICSYVVYILHKIRHIFNLMKIDLYFESTLKQLLLLNILHFRDTQAYFKEKTE